MFFSKGINFLLGKRSAEFDVNSLPDIDSVKEVKEFVSNVQETLKDWRDLDELKVIVEFLVDVSEKYDIIAEFSEIWIGSLYNSFNTELLQQMLDITMNAVEKNPNFFNVTPI